MEVIELDRGGNIGLDSTSRGGLKLAVPSGPALLLESDLLRAVVAGTLCRHIPKGLDAEVFGGHAREVVEAWLHYTWGGMFEFRGDETPAGAGTPVLVGLEAFLDEDGSSSRGPEYIFGLAWVVGGRVGAEGLWADDVGPLIAAILHRYQLTLRLQPANGNGLAAAEEGAGDGRGADQPRGQ